jgi:hypothetical protein
MIRGGFVADKKTIAAPTPSVFPILSDNRHFSQETPYFCPNSQANWGLGKGVLCPVLAYLAEEFVQNVGPGL